MDLCGKCGQAKCECREVRSLNGRASGGKLTGIALRFGLERAPNEPDATLRTRLQLTLISGVPYRHGILGGKLLDRSARSRGIERGQMESDEDLRIRMMLRGRVARVSEVKADAEKRLALEEAKPAFPDSGNWLEGRTR